VGFPVKIVPSPNFSGKLRQPSASKGEMDGKWRENPKELPGNTWKMLPEKLGD